MGMAALMKSDLGSFDEPSPRSSRMAALVSIPLMPYIFIESPHQISQNSSSGYEELYENFTNKKWKINRTSA